MYEILCLKHVFSTFQETVWSHLKSMQGPLKVYICLFTCASTRAVHPKVVTDLSVPTFIEAFRRFTSRKSLPKIMISDNASTYQSAADLLYGRRITALPHPLIE